MKKSDLYTYNEERKMMEMQFQTTKKNTTAGNIAYLLLSFPLGLCYFILVVTGLALGVGTLVIWIGLPILFVTLLMVRGMATIERRLASSLLHVSFPHEGFSQEAPRQSFMRHFANVLRDPSTWTSMIYMMLKLPLGIISFTLALTLPIVSIAVTGLPLAYLISLLVNVILLKNGIHSNGVIIPNFIEIGTQFDAVMFARSFIGVPVGLALWFATRAILNSLALVSGEIARAMLGSGETHTVRPQPEQFYAAPMAQQESQMYESHMRG